MINGEGNAGMDVLSTDLKVTLPDGRVTTHVNLDYAATAPCLAEAAAAVNELLPWYASVHRGAGAASRRCTYAYERARESVADFLAARPDDHVIFTRNTTDAMNLLARALPAGTTVVSWETEHHATLLPWPRAVRLPLPGDVPGMLEDLATALGSLAGTGPVLVAVAGASNVTGELWPLDDVVAVAHRYGARVALDAAQLAPHRPVSMTRLGVDYVALSGHKLYAPFGVGVLAGRSDWLDAAQPYLIGGGATAHVGRGAIEVDWHTGPDRHEAGTPNLLGAVALAAACDTIAAADRDALFAVEQAQMRRIRDGIGRLGYIDELRVFDADHPRVGIVSFIVRGVAGAGVSAYLANEYGIGVRDGLFCAHPLTRGLIEASAARCGGPVADSAVRASIGLGTTDEHVDRLVEALTALPRN